MGGTPAMTDGLTRAAYLVPVIGAAAFVLLLVLERVYPLRNRVRPFLGRAFTNLCMTAMALLAGSLVARFVSRSTASMTAVHGFGLLRLVKMPFAANLVLGFLLMDLTFYYWHRLNHVIPVLWRFHNVHHIDPDLDVTTSLRFHIVEVIYSAVFRAAQVLLLGVSPLIYFVYEIAFETATLFHHSNIRIPIRIERVLNKVIVTPRMHGIHHSDFRDETNSNYSVVFRWWDALNASLRLDIPQSEVRIGVSAYRNPDDNSVKSLMLMPFRKQRDYWNGSERKRRSRVLQDKQVQNRRYMVE